MKKKGKDGLIAEKGTGSGIYVQIKDYSLNTGDRISFAVRESIDSEKLIDKDISVFTEGKAYIPITAEDLDALEPGNYVYGVMFEKSGAEPVNVIREAPFIVQGSVAEDG